MKYLYMTIAVLILIGICQEDYIISLTSGACMVGMYCFFRDDIKKENNNEQDV